MTHKPSHPLAPTQSTPFHALNVRPGLNAFLLLLSLLFLTGAAWTAPAPKPAPPPPPAVTLLQKPHDPFGYPRPARGATGVPQRTSFYFELGLENPKPGDQVSTASITVTLTAKGEKPREVLQGGGRFVRGFTGWVKAAPKFMGPASVGIYFEPAAPLAPRTGYTVQVRARSNAGASLPSDKGKDRWSFTTAPQPRPQNLAFALDLTTAPVRWQGEFFSGFCKPAFCNSAGGLEPSYAMMARDQKQYPRAWTLQRDFWLTGMDHDPGDNGWLFGLPNVVRELETRRVAALTTTSQDALLRVEDFFGHAQYGIPAGRPLSADYKSGYEILIADGKNYARAKVLEVSDEKRTVLVERFTLPAGGFKIDDPAKYPTRENPNCPGLFPSGGTYLQRFAPAGTPRYYWGRVDCEWDIARRYGHRLIVNFTDSPGDVSATGQNWCPPKDYIELRQTAYDITSHTLARYGADACLDAIWSIMNEPDISILFWHGSFEEILKYYDYTTDGILRAFEDRGLDSAKVFIGGLEVGISPEWDGLDRFLKHCSPNQPTTASLNFAFADRRLDGKRSRRVEALCGAHGGKGAPCDFASTHAYNRSAAMARKLMRVKEKALQIDAKYYEKLWACSHEAGPDWMPLPDETFADCYLGDGYYPSWCADVIWRQLGQAARDPRYAMGNTILTAWPWPNGSFGGTNYATHIVKVAAGAGQPAHDETLPLPIYQFLNLLGGMGRDYWVLPERQAAGHTVAGFAARGQHGELMVILYAHDPADTQARGGQEFKIDLAVAGLGGGKARLTPYRFDQDHNSCFKQARPLLKRPAGSAISEREFQRLEKASALRAEKTSAIQPGDDGKIHLSAALSGSGATVLVLENAR